MVLIFASHLETLREAVSRYDFGIGWSHKRGGETIAIKAVQLYTRHFRFPRSDVSFLASCKSLVGGESVLLKPQLLSPAVKLQH